MPLVGTLSTMPLPDLLQWLGTAGKTGTLRVERNKICKAIRMRDGKVIGCSSNDPPQRLGQFLLSRRKITEEHLRKALAAQERNEGPLGMLLVDMGAMTPDELVVELDQKAHEIIYSLFDWEHGTFRFEETLEESDAMFPVDLHVEDVMLRGLQRHDEMARIRSVFHDPMIVLGYTCKPPSPEIFGKEESRSMYSSIDGERCLAEIVLHVHGSEYPVYKFLYDLHINGYVEITAIKEKTEPAPAPLPVPMETSKPASEAPAEPAAAEAASAPAPAAVAELIAEPAPAVSRAAAELAPEDKVSAIAEAGQLMSDGEYEKALDILDLLYRDSPGDEALSRLTAEAEAAFIDKAYRHLVPAAKVPILTKPMEDLASEKLTPHECFILSRIDGSWDVKSIIQVAPFREVDALRTLKRMREMGMIELHDVD